MIRGELAAVPEGGEKIKMNNEPIAEERELLRKQLELLAEKSKQCSNEELIGLSNVMVSIYATLNPL